MSNPGSSVVRLERVWPLAAVVVAALVFFQGAPRAQQPDVSLTDEQRQAAVALVALADEAMKDPDAIAPVPAMWRTDFLKALEGKTYVPFSLSIDPEALDPVETSVYLRVVPRSASGPSEAAEDTAPPPAPLEYPFEDIYVATLPPPSLDQPYRITRAFAVLPGEYDVYVAYRQEGSDDEVKSGVVREPVTIPDFWTDELASSSVILAERVEPLAQSPSADQIAEQPYTFGTTRVVPSFDATFAKSEDLSVIFLVYNPQLGPNQKPDVLVEYEFFVREEGEAERFFNKTNPQEFTAQTLPEEFDPVAGHQLVAGQSVPLGTFPVGDYRLEIRITDWLSGKLLERRVNFAVFGS